MTGDIHIVNSVEDIDPAVDWTVLVIDLDGEPMVIWA